MAHNADLATAIAPYFWPGKDGLNMALPPDKWKYMDLEFCYIYSKLPTF